MNPRFFAPLLVLAICPLIEAGEPAVVRMASRPRTAEEIALADKDPARVLPRGQRPADDRLKPPRNLNSPNHRFVPPENLGEWETRSRRLRTDVQVAAGLWPFPARPPLEPVVHGCIDKGEYTVERVYFSSLPGHYVTGNLYRPKERKGKLPAVLSPHGHWKNGRFYDAMDQQAAEQIGLGAEQFVMNARFVLQARMASLARMGCVGFHFDMVGYADSQAIAHSDGFLDAEAILWGQSFLGLQTWNAIRALDFLASLPDVDPARIGVTGASGGGTQTFLLSAIDDRPAVAFPAVMVSTAMQGGCVCENAPLLRIRAGNVELAALFAPRPLGMTGALDWTQEIETKGLPELQRLYGLYRSPGDVMAKAYLKFGHNYNQVSRELMYRWMDRHLDLGAAELRERPIDPISPLQLTVFDEAHPRPKDERKAPEIRAYLKDRSREQLASLRPAASASYGRYRDVLGPALRAMIADETPRAEDLDVRDLGTVLVGGRWRVDRLLLGRDETRPLLPAEEIPAAAYFPPKWNGTMIVWVDPAGHAGLVDAKSGRVLAAVEKALESGRAILSPDVFLTGEFHAGAETTPGPPIDARYPGYTFCYNRTVLANRVHDVLTAIGCAQHLYQAAAIDLVGRGEAGPWVILARAAAGSAVRRTAADFRGFSFTQVKEPQDPMLLPCALKYGDLSGLAQLCAPGELFAAGWGGYRFEEVQQLARAYRSAGNPSGLHLAEPGMDALDDAVGWILR